MTEQELIDRQRARNDGTFYLMKVGMFYHAYDAGAYALARTMGYRVKCKPRKGGDGVLVSDNVLQDGDVIESRFAVTRRNRTIHKRMREYLYTLTHSEELVTAVLPVGDGITLSTRR